MEQSDKELVSGVIRGEQEAFSVLFQRYRAVVHSHLARIIRDGVAADDLTQEVFLRLWQRAEQWKGQAAFRSWLLRIATHLAFNYLRTVKRRREQPIQYIPLSEEDEEENSVPSWMVDASTLGPDEALARSEQHRLLQRLVDRLPEEKQEVFRLIYDAHMEIREAAAELGIPEGTVKSRIHHARRQIARSWQELDNEWENG